MIEDGHLGCLRMGYEVQQMPELCSVPDASMYSESGGLGLLVSLKTSVDANSSSWSYGT